jgi:hypothetical protein
MKLRVLLVAAVVLVLAGCGSVHPGAAAVVGDTSISMSRADDVAHVYCRLTLLSAQPGSAPPSNADVRRQAVTDLAFGVVARDLAEKKHLTANPSTYEITPAQRTDIAQRFPAGEVDDVVDALTDSQRTIAIAELLGAQKVGAAAAAEQKQSAGFTLLEAEATRRDVRFDPRFGIGRNGLQKAATGSLSVPAKTPSASDAKELPATQQCAA